MELQKVVLDTYQQTLNPNYVPQQDYGSQNFHQECQYQQDHYPSQQYPQYPEPQYPEWMQDCDDGMLPMDMCGM